VKGFDARFFAHQEEIDLCWRLQSAGYRILSCPASVVYHVGAGTLPRGGKKVYLNFRNNLRMLCKNLPKSRLVWTLPLRMGLDALSAWKGLLTGDPAFFTAIVKAHVNVVMWLLRGAPGLYGQRKALWRLQGVYRGSVVWNYFIRGKKRFQEIIG
jgi:GT2 family glycosyltransferase